MLFAYKAQQGPQIGLQKLRHVREQVLIDGTGAPGGVVAGFKWEGLWDLEVQRGEWCRIWTPQAGSHQAFLKGGGRHGQSQPHPESSELRGPQAEDLYGDTSFVPTSAGEGGQPARVRGPCVAEDWKSNLVLLLLRRASWPSLRKGVLPLTVYGLNLDACSWLKDTPCRPPAHPSRVYSPPAPSLVPCTEKTECLSIPRAPPGHASHLSGAAFQPPIAQLVLKAFLLISLVRCNLHFQWKLHTVYLHIPIFFHLYSMNLLRRAAYFSSLL